jgi:aminomethyltransferase
MVALADLSTLLRTSLYPIHKSYGARLVGFAGWEMPILYRGISVEHVHTRQYASIFDVSHMGRLELRGPDAEALLERVCTRRIGVAEVGQCKYTHVCNEHGGILDDVIVSRFEEHWLVVCNAANRDKIVAWLRQHAAGREVTITDQTRATAMVAVQGPRVMALAERLPISLEGLKRYRFRTGSYMGVGYSISRTGYTGEDGIEVILPAGAAPTLWEYLCPPDGPEDGVKPAGLGARDTLRLEAGMPLYGHELNDEIDTLSAGLDWCVDLDKDFIGADALRRVRDNGPQRKLVGLELEGRRIARQDNAVLDRGGQAGGTITSGTMGPTLGRSIAMAYVSAELTEPGTRLQVDLGASRSPAVVVSLPFYKRPR